MRMRPRVNPEFRVPVPCSLDFPPLSRALRLPDDDAATMGNVGEGSRGT